MAGTDVSELDGRGINYRALDDLFELGRARRQDGEVSIIFARYSAHITGHAPLMHLHALTWPCTIYSKICVGYALRTLIVMDEEVTVLETAPYRTVSVEHSGGSLQELHR